LGTLFRCIRHGHKTRFDTSPHLFQVSRLIAIIRASGQRFLNSVQTSLTDKRDITGVCTLGFHAVTGITIPDIAGENGITHAVVQLTHHGRLVHAGSQAIRKGVFITHRGCRSTVSLIIFQCSTVVFELTHPCSYIGEQTLLVNAVLLAILNLAGHTRGFTVSIVEIECLAIEVRITRSIPQERIRVCCRHTSIITILVSTDSTFAASSSAISVIESLSFTIQDLIATSIADVSRPPIVWPTRSITKRAHSIWTPIALGNSQAHTARQEWIALSFNTSLAFFGKRPFRTHVSTRTGLALCKGYEAGTTSSGSPCVFSNAIGPTDLLGRTLRDTLSEGIQGKLSAVHQSGVGRTLTELILAEPENLATLLTHASLALSRIISPCTFRITRVFLTFSVRHKTTTASLRGSRINQDTCRETLI